MSIPPVPYGQSADMAEFLDRVRDALAGAGGWGDPTGTADRAAFDTATVTLEELARRVKALVDDLKSAGILED